MVPGIILYCCAHFFPQYDSEFLKFSSKEKIIRAFIRMRVKLAKTRHDLYFFHNINHAQKSPHTISSNELAGLFPARRLWLTLGNKKREHLSPIERNAESIKLMVSRERKKSYNEQSDWYKTLISKASSFSEHTQNKKNNTLAPPKIRPVPKDIENEIYRPIVSFALDEHIKISVSANYIRQKIDRLMLPCSYAFREKSIISNSSPTHHDAVSDLIQYRKFFSGKTLYVAECDIQKFFDVVNHDVAKKCLLKLMLKNAQLKNTAIDARAINTYISYLNCYSFEGYAVPEANKFFQKNNKPKASLGRPKEKDLRELYKNPRIIKYGIPQGGALSPIIANIILHQADQEIYKAYGNRPKEELFYARYCDDMILIHPDKEVCSMLLEVYCNTLRRLKLIVHPPKEFIKYSKEFYDDKSKEPYPWASPKLDRSTVPWVSFVGYQVNHDGEIRIRRNSINKEINKQEEIALKTIQSIKRNGKLTEKSGHQILYRLKCKMTSMAVGKRYPNSVGPAEGMCWATGFKLLAEHRHDTSQLKKLDRRREASIDKVRKELIKKKVNLNSSKAKEHSEKKKKFTKYFGGSYSYFRGFDN